VKRALAAAGAASLVVGYLVCCAHRREVEPGAVEPMPHPIGSLVDTTPKATQRLVPPEAYLRTYLMWFGGLAPRGVFLRARGEDLFDAWPAYLAALGLPDYRFDVPRAARTSTIMLAALGRLAEALCVRAVEHDLREHPALAERAIFAFDAHPAPSRAQFAEGFDVLHRTFLGYPAELAPADRLDRYFALYRDVVANHPSGKLTGDELAWSAICVALVEHPEAELY
jgi:hypothetical protein